MKRIFFCHTLGPTEHYLIVTAYLNILADHVDPFMSSVHSWLLPMGVLYISVVSSPIEHLGDKVERKIRIMDVQPTNLQLHKNMYQNLQHLVGS